MDFSDFAPIRKPTDKYEVQKVGISGAKLFGEVV
jgi:hypothetical protein